MRQRGKRLYPPTPLCSPMARFIEPFFLPVCCCFSFIFQSWAGKTHEISSSHTVKEVMICAVFHIRFTVSSTGTGNPTSQILSPFFLCVCLCFDIPDGEENLLIAVPSFLLGSRVCTVWGLWTRTSTSFAIGLRIVLTHRKTVTISQRWPSFCSGFLGSCLMIIIVAFYNVKQRHFRWRNSCAFRKTEANHFGIKWTPFSKYYRYRLSPNSMRKVVNAS